MRTVTEMQMKARRTSNRNRDNTAKFIQEDVEKASWEGEVLEDPKRLECERTDFIRDHVSASEDSRNNKNIYINKIYIPNSGKWN